YTGASALTVTAIATETGGLTAETSASLPITVTAVADSPMISVPATRTGGEYSLIPLNIAAVLTDTDGSETLSVTITGVPGDAEIIGGSQPDPVCAPGTWVVTGGNIGAAALRKRDNNSGNAPFMLTFTATSTETDPAANPRTATSAAATSSITVVNLAPEPYEVGVRVNDVDQDTFDGFVTVVPGMAVTFVVATTDP